MSAIPGVAAVRPAFAPSPFQQAIFDFVQTGSGNAIISAVAGSGKTTTIVEALKLAKGSTVFLAFNKSIADELKRRNVNARTFHSLTYGPVTRAMGVREVNQYKLRELVTEHFDVRKAGRVGALATRIVSLAKQSMLETPYAPTKDTLRAMHDICDVHDLEPDGDGVTVTECVEAAAELLRVSNESKQCDFDDLLYFVPLHGIRLPVFDWVFVDEAQDTNALQRLILERITTPSSRLVAVGDRAQAIYGFRGADAASMDMIKEDFDCIELPLSVSYRCATSIVEEAKRYCPQIMARDNAPAGSVRNLGVQWTNKDFAESDLVVCRNTKPLLALAYSLLRDRVSCKVMGRDIGQGLVNLVRRMQAADIDHLVERLEAYKEREIAKCKGDERKAEAVADKVDSLLALAEEMPEGERTVPALVEVLKTMFEGNGKLLLATIHRAKGLEAERVWWLGPSLLPSRFAKKPWQKEQEKNLAYVAITRAKMHLMKIEQVQ